MNENDRLVHEQTGQLDTIARLANEDIYKIDFYILKCENCLRTTTTGLCGCSSPSARVIYDPEETQAK